MPPVVVGQSFSASLLWWNCSCDSSCYTSCCSTTTSSNYDDNTAPFRNNMEAERIEKSFLLFLFSDENDGKKDVENFLVKEKRKDKKERRMGNQRTGNRSSALDRSLQLLHLRKHLSDWDFFLLAKDFDLNWYFLFLFFHELTLY